MWHRGVFRTISRAVNCFRKKVARPQACNFIKKETSTQLVSSEIWFLFKISNSNNLFEDIPAMSLTHNKFFIACNSYNDKLISQEKSLKIHGWERYGYPHLFSMYWKKIFPYIGKSMETSFPYLGTVWVFKFNWFLFKAHGMGIH